MSRRNPARWVTATPTRLYGALATVVVLLLFAVGSCTVTVFGGAGSTDDAVRDAATTTPTASPTATVTTAPGVPDSPGFIPPTIEPGSPTPTVTPKDDTAPLGRDANDTDRAGCEAAINTFAGAVVRQTGDDFASWRDRIAEIDAGQVGSEREYGSFYAGWVPTKHLPEPFTADDGSVGPGSCDATLTFGDGAKIKVSATGQGGEWRIDEWSILQAPDGVDTDARAQACVEGPADSAACQSYRGLDGLPPVAAATPAPESTGVQW